MKTNSTQVGIPEGSLPNPLALQRLQADELSLRKVLGVISRHKFTLLVTMALIVGLGVFILNKIQDTYESEALVLFEDTGARIIPSSELVAKVALDEAYLSSQVAVLQSRELALETMVALNLQSSQEFLEKKGLLPSLSSEPRQRTSNYEVVVNSKTSEVPAIAYEYYRDNLKVSLLPKSRVIAITFRARDAEVAAKVVNTLAETYIKKGLDKKKRSTRETSLLLQDELEELKFKAGKSSRAVQEFKSLHGLDETVGTGLIAQQISQINTQLILARTERVEAQARYSQVQRLVRSGNGVSAIEALDSPVIQKLRDEELETRKKLKELSLEYGVLHPKMVSTRSQLSSLQSSLKQEASRIVAGVRDQLELLRVREQSLTSSLEGLKQKVVKAGAFGVDLQALEREAASNQTLLESYLAKVKSSDAFNGDLFHKANASLLTRGYPALEPVAPKRGAILAIATIGSFLLGLMFVFMKDSLERESEEEIEQQARFSNTPVRQGDACFGNESVVPFPTNKASGERGLGEPVIERSTQRMVSPFVAPLKAVKQGARSGWKPKGMVSVLGSIPEIESGLSVAKLRELTAQESSESNVNQMISRIAASFVGRRDQKSILVTSSVKTLAKPFVAVTAARECSRNGATCIVIDLDFSWPSLHLAMGEDNSLGMIDYLDGKTTLGSIIQRRDGLDLLYAGSREVAPSGYFNHDVLVSVVELLSNDYDKVILLGSPFIVSPDVQKFSGVMDRAVYILPEKIRRNKKVLSEIVKTAKQKKRDAGILYIG